WIKNNAAVIKSGDKYATDLLAANNNSAMTVFDGVLTDDQIKDIIAYLVVAKPEAAATATATGPSTGAPAGGEKHESHIGIILIIIAALLILITVLRTVRKSLQNVVNEKKGEKAVEEGTVWKDVKRWIYYNKTKFAVIVLAVVAFSTVKGWEY